jgi:hypothetical protein
MLFRRNGEVLRTLRDARKYILASPEQHQQYAKWRRLAAAAHRDGGVSFAYKDARKLGQPASSLTGSRVPARRCLQHSPDRIQLRNKLS